MTPGSDQYERVCKDAFGRLETLCRSLDAQIGVIDVALRGNGVNDGMRGRLAQLEVAKAERDELRRVAAEQSRKLDVIDMTLRGGQETDGVVLRLDRLEQKDAARKRLFWLVIGAAVPMTPLAIATILRIASNGA